MAGSGALLRGLLRKIGRRKRDFLVAVDRGLDICRDAGLRPDLAVGDWDSIERRDLLAGLKHLTLPRAKDRSDLYYACLAALNAGVREVVGIGFTGGRLDHQLAIFFDLAGLAQGTEGAPCNVSLISGEASYQFLTPAQSPWRPGSVRGTTVSLFSLDGVARGVSLRGFAYGMTSGELSPSSRGLSNVVVSRDCEIRLSSGVLLAIILTKGVPHL